MPICEICGEDSDKVTKCKSCGYKFCEDCGDEGGKVCIYCEEDIEDDESDDEDEDNGNSW